MMMLMMLLLLLSWGGLDRDENKADAVGLTVNETAPGWCW